MSQLSSGNRGKGSGYHENKANHDVQTDQISSTGWKSGQSTVLMGYEVFNKFPSDYISPDTFKIASQFDTRWVGAICHLLKYSSLELTIQNPDLVNAMSLSDPSVWWSRIEQLSNGANVDYVQYPITMWIDKFQNVSDADRSKYPYGDVYNPYVNRNDTSVQVNYQFQNYDTTDTFQIAPGGTLVVYPRYRTAMEDGKLFFPCLSEEPRIRFYSGNNIQTTTSAAAATSPNLISANTFLCGINFADDVKKGLMQKYGSRNSVTRTIIRERQTFTIQCTSDQEATDSLLTALTGTYAWLDIILSKANPVQNQIYSDWRARDYNTGTGVNITGTFWKKLVDVTLLDSNQNPYNFVKMPTKYLQQKMWGRHWESAIPFEKEIISIPFSIDCKQTREHGKALGQQYMDGNWILRFTPQSVNVSATTTDPGHRANMVTPNMVVELIVIGARCATFTQLKNGRLEFRRY